MRRFRLSVVLSGLGLAVGLIAVVGFESAAAVGKSQAGTAKATTIAVTAGKPSELAFKLSKTSSIPAGTVIFKVTNAGKVPHTFEICLTPSTTANANKCAGKGKATPVLKPGKSATLTVVLAKKGKYEFLCTVPGHAAAGMKGLLGIAVTVSAPPPAKTTTTATTTTSSTTTTASGGSCASPTPSSVTVSMFEFGFTLSQSTVPCGPVTFVVTNNGSTSHDFIMNGDGPNGSGPSPTGGSTGVLDPKASQTITANFTSPGTYTYVCDLPEHASLGMIGKLTVTG